MSKCTRRTACSAASTNRISNGRRAAQALDDDFPAVLAALRRRLEDKSAAIAARTAISYVQLVYGRQLQQQADEQPETGELDVASMTREERDALKRRILARHPELVDGLGGAD